MDNSKFALVIIGYPIIKCNDDLFFGDRCYIETIRQIQTVIPNVKIVSRLRTSNTLIDSFLKLSSACQLAQILPDYGVGGIKGISRYIDILFNKTIKQKLEALIIKADIIFIEAIFFPEAILVAWIAQKYKKKITIEIRGTVLVNIDYMLKRFGLKGLFYVLIHKSIFKYLRNHTDAAIYINEGLQHDFPIRGKNTIVASDCYLPLLPTLNHKKFDFVPYRFLYVGHIEFVKRIDIQLNALSLLKEVLPRNWVFNIIGDGPEVGKLQQEAKNLGIDEHVNFLGRIKWGEDIFNMYKEHDMLFMSSITEGASRTLIEAMAFGLPIISTSVGNAPDLLHPNACVKVANPKNFAFAIKNIIFDKELLETLSSNNLLNSKQFRRANLLIVRTQFWNQIYLNYVNSYT